MSKFREIINAIWYSLPVQLIVSQIRSHKIILIFWLFLFLTITFNFGSTFGVPYLFLAPEFQGDVSFYSLFLLGCALGAFIACYNIATYINDSYKFHFLALEPWPFYIFFKNNLLIPLAFIILYTTCFIQFEIWMEGEFSVDILIKLCGLYLGISVVTLVIFLYFLSTNKNLAQVWGEKFVNELHSRRVILDKAKQGMVLRNRVDHYLGHRFKWREHNPTVPADFRKLVRILNQNHGNALFLQLILLGVIVGLGLLEKVPAFQLPAGVSILLLFSIILMLVAAFTFWLRKLGAMALVLAVAIFYMLDVMEVFKNRHQALGMNYEIGAAPYNAKRITALSSESAYYQDFIHTTNTLNRWKSDFQLFQGKGKKPRAVFICVSGGGLRSAYFAHRCLQRLDSLSNGRLMESTRLFTGASGGMLGVAAYREMVLNQKLGVTSNPNIWDLKSAEPMSRDLLNRVSFKLVSGIFLPGKKERIGSMKYASDRGFSFDDQVQDNLPLLRNRRLGDYTELEELAVIPMMVLSPVIVNDGRRLYISASPVSYLSRSLISKGKISESVTGIEFRRFFRKQWADSLLFVTGIRMNASFPFITPYIQLPSEPPMQVIDAGVADNYGLQTTVKFIKVFRDWLRKNTDRVMILQIRDSKSTIKEVPPYYRKNLLNQILDPIGATYSSFSLSKEMENEDYLNFAQSWLPDKLDYSLLQYEPTDTNQVRAALSWHLTTKEVESIEESLYSEKSQEVFDKVADWLKQEE